MKQCLEENIINFISAIARDSNSRVLSITLDKRSYLELVESLRPLVRYRSEDYHDGIVYSGPRGALTILEGIE